MATVVEISKTSHLTYSPLNQKHNVLYHRARQNVNQRHIQKPWFDLNPFLDKNDDKGMDLESYNPDNDRGVHPLESLTIVEDFCSDKPLMTREFKIGEFWDFLFSGDWADGYSLRVLEGRLQNMIFTCLVTMKRTGITVQHSTRAFAKNRRKRYAIYKLSTKPPELGRYEETLLLEFIYYGHVRSTCADDDDGSSAGYARATTCSTVTNASTDLESSDQDIKALVQRPTPTPTPKPPPKPRVSLLQRYMSLPNNPGRRERVAPINKRLSHVKETSRRPGVKTEPNQSAMPKIPRGTRRKDHRSDVSSGSSDYYPCAGVPQSLDLSKFMCTENVAYLGEFELSDDSSSSSSGDDEPDFGQTLYIGDRAVLEPAGSCKTDSVESKLQKRKHVIKKQREERRKVLEELNRPLKPLFPEFSELDINKYLSTIKLADEAKAAPERVPDFEEYIEMLQEDDMVDPRIKNKTRQKLQQKMKSRMKRQQEQEQKDSQMKSGLEKFADSVGTVTSSHPCRLHCYNADRVWKAMPEPDKRNFLIQKLINAGVSIHIKAKRKARKEKRRLRKLQIPLIYITTIKQITYLAPVSRPLFMKRMQEDEHKKARQSIPTVQRRTSLRSAQLGALATELNKKRRGSPEMSPTRLDSEETNKTKFPKAISYVSGTESPDILSDEEDDGLTESPFDTHKLRMQYSLERIRKTKAERRRRKNREQGVPEFYSVLKKYYRMQSILKAFSPAEKRKSSAGIRHSIAGCLPTKKQKARQRRNTFLPKVEKLSEVVVGKMKHFPFLDAKRKLFEPIEEDETLFENYPMNAFHENLERALKEFVVRRELVISDYNAKASVSITFTKKSVFVKSRMQ